MFFRPLQVFGLVAPFLAFSATAAASALSRRATVCNGHSELCEKTYGTVSYVGAHNSYAVGVNNLAVNQDHDVTQQLTDGIRLLQLQAHNQNGGIQLCHSSCSLFNGGSLQDYLVKVKTWMDANPNEVVTILIVNINNQPATAFDAAYKAAGLDAISFIPETAVIPASGWPTLGSMIDSGRRLVTFLDNQADPSVPYLMDEFTNIWETQFNVVTTFDCNVNRTRGETATQMYLVNHFLNKVVFGQPAPDPDRANTTNAVSGPNSLGDQVEQCAGQHNKPPTFMLVDFYEFGGGSVFQVAATINGVAYNPTTPVATPRSTGTGSGATPTTSTSSRPIGGDNGALSLGVQPLFLLVGGLLLGSYVVL